MNRTSLSTWILIGFALVMLALGCSKERIVESTEYIENTEYIQLPGDTIVQVVTIYDTVFTGDTVYSVQYDTVTIVDTIGAGTGGPNAHLAISALQYHNNPLVIEFVTAELGLSDGWIFYLSEYQTDMQETSPGVYDFFGYIDFWAPDWSGYYPLEFLWRMVHTGGDPSLSSNWQLTDSPTGVTGFVPGIHFVKDSKRVNRLDQ